MALEDEYNIEIPAEELTDLETVGDVIEYLKMAECMRHNKTLPEAYCLRGFTFLKGRK